jgi:bacterioferritin-associated ferredoxin
MYVCHCEAVNDRAVDAAIISGASSVAEVTARCHAGGGCGGCHGLIETMIEAVRAHEELTDRSVA